MIPKSIIKKVIDTINASYDSFKGVLVYNNLVPMDTDSTSIAFCNDKFYFEFMDDNIEDFEIKIIDIKDIEFEEDESMKVSIIILNSGEIVTIHCL